MNGRCHFGRWRPEAAFQPRCMACRLALAVLALSLGACGRTAGLDAEDAGAGAAIAPAADAQANPPDAARICAPATCRVTRPPTTPAACECLIARGCSEAPQFIELAGNAASTETGAVTVGGYIIEAGKVVRPLQLQEPVVDDPNGAPEVGRVYGVGKYFHGTQKDVRYPYGKYSCCWIGDFTVWDEKGAALIVDQKHLLGYRFDSQGWRSWPQPLPHGTAAHSWTDGTWVAWDRWDEEGTYLDGLQLSTGHDPSFEDGRPNALFDRQDRLLLVYTTGGHPFGYRYPPEQRVEATWFDLRGNVLAGPAQILVLSPMEVLGAYPIAGGGVVLAHGEYGERTYSGPFEVLPSGSLSPQPAPWQPTISPLSLGLLPGDRGYAVMGEDQVEVRALDGTWCGTFEFAPAANPTRGYPRFAIGVDGTLFVTDEECDSTTYWPRFFGAPGPAD